MLASPDVVVTIDLPRVRANAEAIAAATGRPILAVIKADAYGLGAAEVAEALAEVVAGFYVFRPQEAIDARLERFTGKDVVALHCDGASVDDLTRHRIQPVVWDVECARCWQAAKPVLSIDTGQGRFGCEASDVEPIVAAGQITEAMTHATAPVHVERFVDALRESPLITFRHVAGSALLNDPAAWLDAVRPGLALYDGAVRVTTRLVEVRDSHGRPAGYTGFRAQRYGVILAGYSNGIRKGICAVNGRTASVLEVGMQSSFVELSERDLVGDEVELLGPTCRAADVAKSWSTSPQEVLFQLSRSGVRRSV